MEDLPDELLAGILRRVPPRSLAVCRSVCKHWCGAVDTHELLLAVAHRVPCSLHGIFVNYVKVGRSGYFSRVTAGTTSQPSIDAIVSWFASLPGQLTRHRSVLDPCNGLLLYENKQVHVCNPVTRRRATLPAPPRAQTCYSHLPYYRHRMYLMFDPTMSLHYHVLFFPDAPDRPKPPYFQPAGVSQFIRANYEHECNTLGVMEWPPYMYPLQVFSSKTGRWEEKQFVRQGDAAVTVSDVWSDGSSPISCQDGLRRHAVYWRASFYVYCDTGFIMRLSLEDQKYLAIKTPRLDITWCKRHLKTYEYLGKSKHGVYFTAFHGYQLKVWVLSNTLESCRTPEWELKHQADLEPNLKLHYNRHFRREKYEKCWILDSCDEESESDEEFENSGDYAWDSRINMDYKDYYFAVDLLGYHPYREIAFLGNRFQGFAYYLDNSKLKYLGSPYPSYLNKHDRRLLPMLESFIYTPSMDDMLPVQNDA
ncbi:hypothetical protein VPH35_019572 [Triticum aestivum]